MKVGDVASLDLLLGFITRYKHRDLAKSLHATIVFLNTYRHTTGTITKKLSEEKLKAVS